MKRLLVLVIIAVAISLFLRAYCIEGIYVASASMEPTLNTGSYFFLEKVSYRLHPVKRGDIVVFPSPASAQDKDLIKRVIAVAGDTIEIKEKVVFINGVALNEPYVQHTRANEELVDDNFGPLKVPTKMVFVMGDNRDESGDSRDWKDSATHQHIYFIAVENIKGRILELY
ncbi:MAG: signal peptidase I [Elusimicrobia bacterium RIFOXYA2_FULL_50_26]|nr:MAG: signal peptidase I [Elusimicrobia bacterium RIFOXYA2_FULL_50_26]